MGPPYGGPGPKTASLAVFVFLGDTHTEACTETHANTTTGGTDLAKPNYSFEKRQRELAKKKKQEEKRQRKAADKVDRVEKSSPDIAGTATPADSAEPQPQT